MKKSLTFFLLCICGVAVSQGVEVGPLVGANFSWQTYKEGFASDRRSSQIKSGIMAGAYARFFVSEKFSIQPELMFAGYGAKFENDKIKMNYLALPVLARLHITPAVFAFAGPQAGFLVGGTDRNGYVEFRSTHVSFPAGVGCLIKESGLEISVRYNQGISVISKPLLLRRGLAGDVYSYNVNVRMSSFQIVLLYRLLGGEKK